MPEPPDNPDGLIAAAVRQLVQVLYDVEFSKIVTGFVADPAQVIDAYPGHTVPIPGSCHLYYQAQRTRILSWLSSRTADVLHLPMLRRLRVDDPGWTSDRDVDMPCHTLRKRQCFGLAPYVGEPFVYLWQIAIDEVGRAVATDAHIVYREGPAHA